MLKREKITEQKSAKEFLEKNTKKLLTNKKFRAIISTNLNITKDYDEDGRTVRLTESCRLVRDNSGAFQ